MEIHEKGGYFAYMNDYFEVKFEGESTIIDLASFMEGAKRLDPRKVERGNIWIRTIGSNDVGSISLLFLSPKAKVGKHTHVSDSEVYGIWGGENHMCPAGDSHSLENTSETHWGMVISTKWNAK